MRTAAAQLEFTVHLPRLDAGPFTCAVWTPAHELRIQAPPGITPSTWGRSFVMGCGWTPYPTIALA